VSRVYHYYGRLQEARGRFGGLPAWARALVWLAAVPGLALIALSILVLAASILALLLLALPVYLLLKWVTGLGRRWRRDDFETGPSEDFADPTAGSPGRKRVSATVIETFEDRATP
jgi:hypothetical protein